MPANFLPWTVIVAVLIFLAREFLDEYRRSGVAERKARAVKALVAAELERNKWVIISLRRQFELLKKSIPLKATLHLEVSKTGQPILTVTEQGHQSGGPIFLVHKAVLERKLESFAEIGDPIFRVALESFDALQELEHVRQSFIDYVAKATETKTGLPDFHFSDFLDYGLEELDDADAELARLYLSCTGNKFVQHRVR